MLMPLPASEASRLEALFNGLLTRVRPFIREAEIARIDEDKRREGGEP